MPTIPKPQRRQDERQLMEDIKLRINQEPDFVVFRNNLVEGFYAKVDPKTGKAGQPFYVKAGLGTGSPDLVGIQAMGVTYQGRSLLLGRFFAPEIKVDGEDPRANQEEWAERARLYGACVPTLRSVEDAVAALERARKGEDR